MFRRIFSEGQIGKFLKKWAKVSMVIHIILAVIILLVGIFSIMANAATRLSAAYTYRSINVGATFAWVFGFSIGLVLAGFAINALLYAFGTLVDSSATQQRLLEKQTYLLNQIAQSTSAAPAGGSQPAKDDTLPPL